jgi:cytolysin-activating lysine-acyltransferase
MEKASVPTSGPRQGAAATPSRSAARRAPEMLSRSAALGDIVSILMRSPKHKALPLDSLRRSVLPAIMHNQFRIARIRKAGRIQAAPAGFAMWASVSDAVDERLRSATQQPITLAFDEWRSGSKLWLIDLIAPPALAATLLRDLDEKVGNGKQISAHVTSSNGGMAATTVATLLDSLKKIPA